MDTPRGKLGLRTSKHHHLVCTSADPAAARRWQRRRADAWWCAGGYHGLILRPDGTGRAQSALSEPKLYCVARGNRVYRQQPCPHRLQSCGWRWLRPSMGGRRCRRTRLGAEPCRGHHIIRNPGDHRATWPWRGRCVHLWQPVPHHFRPELWPEARPRLWHSCCGGRHLPGRAVRRSVRARRRARDHPL